MLVPEVVATLLVLLDRDGHPNVAAVYELTRKRARDPLPGLRIGKRLRFRRGDLLAWIDRQRVHAG